MYTSMHGYTEIGHGHLMVFISRNVFYNSNIPVYNEILLSYSTSEPVESSNNGGWGNDKLQCRFSEDLIVNILFQNCALLWSRFEVEIFFHWRNTVWSCKKCYLDHLMWCSCHLNWASWLRPFHCSIQWWHLNCDMLTLKILSDIYLIVISILVNK